MTRCSIRLGPSAAVSFAPLPDFKLRVRPFNEVNFVPYSNICLLRQHSHADLCVLECRSLFRLLSYAPLQQALLAPRVSLRPYSHPFCVFSSGGVVQNGTLDSCGRWFWASNETLVVQVGCLWLPRRSPCCAARFGHEC